MDLHWHNRRLYNQIMSLQLISACIKATQRAGPRNDRDSNAVILYLAAPICYNNSRGKPFIAELCIYILGTRGGHALSTNEQDDAVLVERLASGDVEVIGTLYDRYGRLIYTLALRIVHETGVAEEITQEVFVRLWRAAASFHRERGTVHSWLLRITHNLALNEVRRQQSRPISADTFDWVTDGEQLPDEQLENDPQQMVVLRERSAMIQSALRQLPEPQRQVIELAFYGGLSQAEIAAALGFPIGTVKSRIRLGMFRLREVLSTVGIDGQWAEML